MICWMMLIRKRSTRLFHGKMEGEASRFTTSPSLLVTSFRSTFKGKRSTHRFNDNVRNTIYKISSKFFSSNMLFCVVSLPQTVNIYGFERVTTGVQKGSYTHKLFVRGKPNLCRFMVRTKIKRKNGSKASFSRTESCPNTGYNRTSGMDFSHGPFSIGAPNQPFNLFQANNLAASSATAKMLGLTTSMSRYKPQVDDRRQPQAINSSKLLPSTTLFPNGSQSLTTMLGGTIRETPHGREDTADTLDLDSIFADDIQDRSITSPTNAQPDQLGIISDLMEEGYGAPMDRSERPKLNEDLADELVRMFLPGERDCTTTDYY